MTSDFFLLTPVDVLGTFSWVPFAGEDAYAHSPFLLQDGFFMFPSSLKHGLRVSAAIQPVIPFRNFL